MDRTYIYNEKQLGKIEGKAGEDVDRVDSIYETNRRECMGKNSYKDVKVTRTVGERGECRANLTDLRVVKKKKTVSDGCGCC